MTVGDALEAIGAAAPPERAAQWDAVGLQIGDASADVTSAGVCHEVTEDVAGAAVAAGLDLLITYHPLIFRPLDRVVAGSGVSGRTFRLAAAGVSLISVHTVWDVAPGGAADALAAAFGLSDVVSFGPLWGADSVKVITYVPASHVDVVSDALGAAGAGVIGRYSGCSFRTSGVGSFVASESAPPHIGMPGEATSVDEIRIEMSAPAAALASIAAALVAAHPYKEPAWDVLHRTGDAGFVGRTGLLADGPLTLSELGTLVKSTLGAEPRVAGHGESIHTRIAVMPGSGGDFVDLAAATGADAVITGDVSHHRARAALDAGVAVIDAGHVPTERPGLATLYAAVCDIVPGTVDLRHIDPDPWRPPA